MNQALISELDKIPFSKSFSGHETFAFRYSWLKKGVDLLTVDPAIFQSAEASVRFGVGKNMVRSIRHWCLATRVAEEEPNSRSRLLHPTKLGEKLLSENGWDPFLEDDATLWLIHWNLASAGTRAATWYWAFSQFQEYAFTKTIMTESLARDIQSIGWSNVSSSTLKRDVDCFVQTYLSRKLFLASTKGPTNGVVGTISGKITDKFGPRVVVTIAGVLLSSGCLLLSQVNSLWQLYLFYGVLIGVGMGGVFIPLASPIARWFVRRRGMMTGIVVSGLSIGTLIMSPVATWLISNYGWRTSYMAVGIAAFILVIPTAQVLKHDPRQVGQLPYGGDNGTENNSGLRVLGYSFLEAMHTQQFWMLAIAWLCFGIGLGTVLVHIVPHAIDLGISAASAAMILSIIGGLGAIGRVAMGSVSDRIGIKLSLFICFVIISMALFWLLAAKELWMLYLFATIFGFGYGGVVALASPVIAEQFGLSSHGVILGSLVLFAEIGDAIGPVASGYLFDLKGNYDLAFLTEASIAVIGLILISLLRAPAPRK